MKLTASALIFDLDGTLIDSKPGILESFGTAVAGVYPGREFDLSTVVLGPPIQRMFEMAFPSAGATEVAELLRLFRAHYNEKGSLRVSAYEGAGAVLEECRQRGLVMHIATNKPLRVSLSILAYLKLDHFFRSILAIDSIQPPFAGKAAILRHLLQEQSLQAQDVHYLGDSAEDAAAAAACGLRFIWAAYGYGRFKELERGSFWGTIHRLGDLSALLR